MDKMKRLIYRNLILKFLILRKMLRLFPDENEKQYTHVFFLFLFLNVHELMLSPFQLQM
jgi:hypothetical protein